MHTSSCTAGRETRYLYKETGWIQRLHQRISICDSKFEQWCRMGTDRTSQRDGKQSNFFGRWYSWGLTTISCLILDSSRLNRETVSSLNLMYVHCAEYNGRDQDPVNLFDANFKDEFTSRDARFNSLFERFLPRLGWALIHFSMKQLRLCINLAKNY